MTQTSKPDPEKYCITCDSPGHTYLECPVAPFGAMVAGLFGVPNIMGMSPEQANANLKAHKAMRNHEDDEETSG